MKTEDTDDLFCQRSCRLRYERELVALCESRNLPCIDIGTHDSRSCNYAEYGRAAALAVSKDPGSLGILICGTGAGISIAANKILGVRCVCASEPATARLAREHNDANMLALGARIVGTELARDMMTAFLETPFSGESRHSERIASIEG